MEESRKREDGKTEVMGGKQRMGRERKRGVNKRTKEKTEKKRQRER